MIAAGRFAVDKNAAREYHEMGAQLPPDPVGRAARRRRARRALKNGDNTFEGNTAAMEKSTRKIIGIVCIYSAALLIMLSILFLFRIIRFPLVYTPAAVGFLVYVVGMFLTREGKFSAYKTAMLVVAVVLIVFAVIREIS